MNVACVAERHRAPARRDLVGGKRPPLSPRRTRARNVLTTEVFQALDFLPRAAFFGRILGSVSGGASETVERLSQEVEQLKFTLLNGDIYLANRPQRAELCVQPDGVIESSSVYCLLEAKRIKPRAFHPEQLAREYLAVVQEARGRRPLLLLVLPEPPPVAVSGHGRLEIDTAVGNYLEHVRSRCEHEFSPDELMRWDVSSVIAYITWPALVEAISAGLREFRVRIRRLLPLLSALHRRLSMQSTGTARSPD